jgi:hypothetical protein
VNFTAKALTLTALACLVAGILLGFIPEYVAKSHLEEKMVALTNEGSTTRKSLHQTQNQLALNQFALQAAVISADTNINNYEAASRQASNLFTQLRQYLDTTGDNNARQTLTEVLSMRDSTIAGLAKADPGVRSELGQIFKKLQALSTESAQ